jgi:membrane-bound lytic murein transglycosylase A
MRQRLFTVSALLLVLAACGQRSDDTPAPTPPAGPTYAPVPWAQLTEWSAAEAEGLTRAFAKTCEVYLKRAADRPVHAERPLFGTYADWRPVCEGLATATDLKAHYEAHLTPVRVTEHGNNGLFTGYYEPELKGAFGPSAATPVPVHRRPPDLLEADLGAFHPDLRGRRIGARAENGRLVPYHDRAKIGEGVLGEEQILLWVNDPVEKFFLQVQGSGRVRLPDGNSVNIGYAGANGHRYVSIGRYLIDQGEMTLEQVSLQSIRAWLAANPDRKYEVLNANPSYVFFRLNDGGPYGTMGVELEPEHALAVDPAFIPMGVPTYVSTTLTADGGRPYARAMAAQDTGGAIKGAIRGDIFFGHGDEAERRAGHQRSEGQLFLLLPNTLAAQAATR